MLSLTKHKLSEAKVIMTMERVTKISVEEHSIVAKKMAINTKINMIIVVKSKAIILN